MHKIDIQGHRGARGLRPENTLGAFDLAVRLGVDTLELDVVISNDAEVIVSHDRTMSPEICSWPDGRPVLESESSSLILYQMPLDEIQLFDCGRRKHPGFPHQEQMPAKKPLLREVIRQADNLAIELGQPKPRYNIETKSTPAGDGILNPTPEEFVSQLLGVLSEFDHAAQAISKRCVIQSFDMRTLRIVRSHYSSFKTSLLVEYSDSDAFEKQIERLGFTPDIYSPDYRVVSRALIDSCRKLKIDVLPWTVNDSDEMLRLVKLGISGLITDYPNRAIEIFRKREG
ncbi:MAG: glycerophosphodiester phosphodiesterase [Bacteroidetes bacterium]|nr:MAG: glycerophosphodiester phosphodiesterase [Bacteroidota bacterium]